MIGGIVMAKKNTMRPRLFLLLFVVLPFWPACKKHLVCCGPPEQSTVFDGDWRLLRVTGGIAGQTINVPADSVVILDLNLNYSYAYRVNGVLRDTGRLTVKAVPGGVNGDTLALRFSSDTSISYIYRAQGDTLQLAQYLDDGFDYLYTRVR